MKIFICTNKFQKTAAKVSAYSFYKLGYNNIEIIEIEQNEILKNKLNSYYLRNGKLTKFVDDLQSFTLLRFLPFTQKKDKRCLIIDPDIFALQNPKELINNIYLNNDFKIACTKINNKYRSEVIFLNNIDFNWSYEDLINDLFNHKVDYKELIDLSSNKYFSNIIQLPDIFNHHDKIANDTLFLHTTKRITQPWKEGLKINFYKEDISFLYRIKQRIKKTLNLSYNKSAIANFYTKHPNKKVYDVVLKLFKESLGSNTLNKNELLEALNNKYISKIFFEKIFE